MHYEPCIFGNISGMITDALVVPADERELDRGLNRQVSRVVNQEDLLDVVAVDGVEPLFALRRPRPSTRAWSARSGQARPGPLAPGSGS